MDPFVQYRPQLGILLQEASTLSFESLTFFRKLTFHATVSNPPTAPVMGSLLGTILSIGAFVLNIKIAIACCLPVDCQLLLTQETARGLLTSYCPAELLLPSQAS